MTEIRLMLARKATKFETATISTEIKVADCEMEGRKNIQVLFVLRLKMAHVIAHFKRL